MFPWACPLLQPHVEALDGLGQAAGCTMAQCDWFDRECMFVTRFQRLIKGQASGNDAPEAPVDREPGTEPVT